jgi:hypothetical protein
MKIITYHGIKLSQKQACTHISVLTCSWRSNQGYCTCWAAAHNSCAKPGHVQTCIQKQKMCSFSKVFRITHGASSKWNTICNRNISKSRTKHTTEGGSLPVFQKVGDYFSICCKFFCTFFLTNKTKKQLVFLVTFMPPNFWIFCS